MRRAIYQGRHALGFQDSFFYKVTNFVVDQMHEPYPELEVQRNFIEKMVKLEEERFGSTMTVGLQKLDEIFVKGKEAEQPAYRDLARLYDTFGTPRDLIRVSLEFRGFAVDEGQFNESFDTALHLRAPPPRLIFHTRAETAQSECQPYRRRLLRLN